MSEQAVFDALRYCVEVNKCGTRRYYSKAGQLHRTNGPAVEYPSGRREWYQNDQLHRTDGPAIEWPSGAKSWYINGEHMSKAEFNQRVKLL